MINRYILYHRRCVTAESLKPITVYLDLHLEDTIRTSTWHLSLLRRFIIEILLGSKRTEVKSLMVSIQYEKVMMYFSFKEVI